MRRTKAKKWLGRSILLFSPKEILDNLKLIWYIILQSPNATAINKKGIAMKKSVTPTQEVTFKSVCDAKKERLCNIPCQDFCAAADVREIQRAIDPKGRKKLTPRQARTLKRFLNLVVKIAYA